MLRVNGFYGHIRRNDLRSLVMFAGFLLAFQVIAAVVLALPLLFIDFFHSPFFPLAYAETYAPAVLVGSIGLFVARLLRHVATVRADLAFVEVDRRADPRLVNIVETLAISAGLPIPKAGMIECRALNAFACGLTPGSAVVVVTRGLVESLDDDELTAVVAHEIAHIAHGDIRLLAAANVLMENLLLLQRKNVLRLAGWKQVVVGVLIPPVLFLFLAAGFFTRVAMTLARASRLLISSSREFIADAEAVRLTHNPAALISALRRIEGRSEVPGLALQADAMMIDGAVEGPFASHPTIAERIAVLARLSSPMAAFGAPGGTPPRSAGTGTSGRFGAFSRVNAGSDENLFGVTPKVKRMLKIGFGILVGLQLIAMVSARFVVSGVEPHFEKVSSTLPPSGASSVPASKASKLEREAERLAKLGPAEARCYRTDRYEVGDRGLHGVNAIAAERIEAYADAGSQSSDIVPERYLGLRLRSVRAALAARDADLDLALLSYVETRKSMLFVMHRFFGDAGLDVIARAYDGAEDRQILDKLRQRLAGDAPLLRENQRRARDMEFLVSSPKEFVPCLARAMRRAGG